MTSIILALFVGCSANQTEEPSLPPEPKPAQKTIEAKPVPAAPEPETKPAKTEAPTKPIVCPDGSAPTAKAVAMGSQELTTHHCAFYGENRIVSVQASGSDWTWKTPEDESEHAFEWIGKGSDGQSHMVLRFWVCPTDGCERSTFFRWGPDGTIEQMGKTTTAYTWRFNPDGRLEYKEKEGLVAGYSIASANQTYVWNGTDFQLARPPFAAIEFDTWPCEDTEVAVVSPSTGQPTGATVPVKQGDKIDVLNIGSSQPLGSLFEYRVNGATFWAAKWEQTCAG